MNNKPHDNKPNDDDVIPGAGITQQTADDIAKSQQLCRDFNAGKITRDDCRRRLMAECNIADHKLDDLLDAYDPQQ